MPSDVLITPATSKIDFTDASNSTKKLSISGTTFSFNSNLNVLSTTSLSSAFKAEGVNGTLFEVTDDLSNSLMSVNTIGGLPVFEVFANNSIIAGQYNANDFVISGNKIGLGYANPVNKLSVSGSVSIGASYNVAAPSNGLIVQGDVGIGTASFTYPSAGRGLLEIYGSAESLIALKHATGNLYIQKTSVDTHINNSGAGMISISTNNSERWRITSGGILQSNGAQTLQTSTGILTLATLAGHGHIVLSPHGNGNVGIGTATPADKLEIEGGIRLRTGGGITLRNATNDSSAAIYNAGGGGGSLIYLAVGPSPTMTIGTNVGIGIVSPSSRLHVYSSVTGSAGAARTTPIDVLTLESENTDNQEFTGFGQSIVFRGSTYNNAAQRTLGKIIHQINDDSVNTTRGTSLDFQLLTDGTGTALASRMYIRHDGNVGIGTVTPAYKLDVNGTTRFGGIVYNEAVQTDDFNYFNLQPYIESETLSSILSVSGTAPTFATLTNTTAPFSKVLSVSAYGQAVMPDFIPVQAGETIYGEIWAYRATGAAGTAGVLYCGVQRFDKDKNMIDGNVGLNTSPSGYFIAYDQTIPSNSTWTKYSGTLVLPTSHTVFNGSDGGPVRYIRPYIIYNYTGGTILTYITGWKIRKVQLTRDLGPVAINGSVAIGANNVNYGRLQISATGTSPSLSATNPTDPSLIVSNSDVLYGTMFATYSDGKGALQQRRTDAATYYDFSLQPHGGNVGIGTASPGALLDVSGVIRSKSGTTGTLYLGQTSGGTTYVAAALIGSPSAAYNPVGKLSIQLPTHGVGTDYGLTEQMSIQVNGSDSKAATMLLLPNGGNVGIGTTSPTAKLHVEGSQITLNTENSYAEKTLYFRYSNGARIQSDSYLTFYTAGSPTEKMRITAGGNVGIGTTNPVGKLDVRAGSGEIIFGTYDANYTVRIQSGDQLNFYNGASANPGYINYAGGATNLSQNLYVEKATGGTTGLVRIKANGSVGIGTATPNSTLQIAGTSAGILTVGTLTNDWGGVVAIGTTNGNGIILSKVNTANDSNRVLVLMRDDTNGASIIGYAPAGTFASVGFQIRANASSYFNGGNVGIGITNPAVKLHVNSTVAGDTLVRADGTNGTLFSVVDDLSDSLMSVNNSAGLPVLEVFADDRIVAGQYGQNDLVVINNKVGIGTNSPAYKLDVRGSTVNARVGLMEFGTWPLAATYIYLQNNTLSLIGGNYALLQGPTGETFVNAASGQVLHFRTNNTERWAILAAGILQSDGAQTIQTSTGPLTLATLAGDGHIILSPHGTGNVGIGTASPSMKLDVRGGFNIGGGSEGIRLGNVGDNAAYDNVKLYYTGYNSGSPRIYLTPRTQPGSGTVNTYFHLLSNTAGGPGANTIGLLVDGNVGIGTVSPAAKLDVNGTAIIQYEEGQNQYSFRGANRAINDWDSSGLTNNPTINSYADGSWFIDSGVVDNWERGLLSKRRFRRVEGLTLEYESYTQDNSFGVGGVYVMIGFVGGDSVNFSYSQTPSNLTYQANGTLDVYTNSSNSGPDYSFDTRNAWWRFKTVLKGAGALHYVYRNNKWNLIKETSINNQNDYEYLRVIVSLYRQRIYFRDVKVYVAQESYRGSNYLDNVAGNLFVNGNVGIGISSPTSLLHLAGVGGDGVPFLRIAGTASDPFNWGSSVMYANLAATETAINLIGKAQSQYNSCYIGYRHVADGSASNMLSLGLYAADHLVNILGNGHVGIGITSPAAMLHVEKSQNSETTVIINNTNSGAAAAARLDLQSNASNYLTLQSYGQNYSGNVCGIAAAKLNTILDNALTANSTGLLIGTTSTNPLYFVTANAVKMTLNASGSVGIGNITPANKLAVSGSVSVGSNYNVAAPANGLIVEGSVGIGTTSPSRKFHVYNNANGFISRFTGGASSDVNIGIFGYTGAFGSIGTESNHSLNIFTNGTDKVTITSAGLVGIGITSPAYKLDVGASGSDVISVRLTPGYERVRFHTFDLLGYNDGNLWMIGNNPTATLVLGKSWDWDNQIGIAYTAGTVGAAGGSLEIGQLSKNNVNFTHGNTRFYTNGIERIRITSAGNVGIGTVTPTSKLHLNSTTSGAILLKADGTNGTLFSVSDDLSNSLMSVNTIGGLPVFEVFANNSIIAGQYGQNDFVISGNKVGIGTASPAYKLDVNGTVNFASTNDQILTLNKSSGTAWNYIGFSQAGTRRFYFGLNSSFEPELGVDNGGTFRVVGGMTVAGNAVLTSASTSAPNLSVGGSSGSCTGNAATATARNINGTSFNHSADITTASWGTGRTITIGSTGKSVNGSAAVAWTLAEIAPGANINYAAADGWTAGTGNGVGYYGGDFTLNGSSAENTRSYKDTPYASPGLVWATTNNDATSNDDGGWNKEITGLTANKTYRSIVWVRRSSASTNGNFYHGCSSGATLNLDNSANTNPYFGSFGINTFTQDVWYLSVGYVRANDNGSTTPQYGGLYDGTTGQKVVNYTDFKMAAGATAQTHRVYLYYSTDSAALLDFWGPRFEEVNGNEPSIGAMLGFLPSPRFSGTPTVNGNAILHVGSTVAVANGGTGGITQAAGRTGLGATTLGANLFTLTNVAAERYIKINSDNTVTTMSSADFKDALSIGAGSGTVTGVTATSPLAATAGNAPVISLSGTVALANGGSGQTSAQAAMNAFAGAVTSGSYLRGNGTNVVMSTILAADLSGTASNLSIGGSANSAASATTAGALTSMAITQFTGTLAVANGGTGAATFPTGQILYGNGTSAIQSSANLIFSSNNLGIGTSPGAFKLDVNGTVHYVAIQASSDGRFKKNVQVISNPLDKISSLRGVRFEWNEFINARRDGYELNRPTFGVIAQELEEVFPELISLWRLSDDCTDARSVNYEKIIPILIEAVKELNNKNKLLESRILNLENKQI